MTGHVPETHENCQRSPCVVCDLYICRICGGAEGSLLPVCPGRRLSADEDAANYAKYCAGTGPFARPHAYFVADAVRACLDRSALNDGHGAFELFDAVVELYRWVRGVQ